MPVFAPCAPRNVHTCCRQNTPTVDHGNEHVYHSNLSLGGASMSHVFQVPDDIYTEIAAYAAQRGQTPDALLMALVTGEWNCLSG